MNFVWNKFRASLSFGEECESAAFRNSSNRINLVDLSIVEKVFSRSVQVQESDGFREKVNYSKRFQIQGGLRPATGDSPSRFVTLQSLRNARLVDTLNVSAHTRKSFYSKELSARPFAWWIQMNTGEYWRILANAGRWAAISVIREAELIGLVDGLYGVRTEPYQNWIKTRSELDAATGTLQSPKSSLNVEIQFQTHCSLKIIYSDRIFFTSSWTVQQQLSDLKLFNLNLSNLKPSESFRTWSTGIPHSLEESHTLLANEPKSEAVELLFSLVLSQVFHSVCSQQNELEGLKFASELQQSLLDKLIIVELAVSVAVSSRLEACRIALESSEQVRMSHRGTLTGRGLIRLMCGDKLISF